MNRSVLVIAALAGCVALGAFWFLSSGRDAPPPAAVEAPAAEMPAPAPAPEAPPEPEAAPPARRAPAPPAVVREAPVPPVVETAPELGTLRIETDVPGAQVFIDRQFIGTAPLTAENVKPGTHQVNVTAEGFDGIAQTIDVESGPRDLVFRLRDVRLDASAAVIHRHRIGSCRGRLVATVDGLVYETDGEDAFRVSLADIDTFQIDYAEKNLRIRVRNGRQYNFADPDGNADRLFVFHRDVDRARARLAQ